MVINNYRPPRQGRKVKERGRFLNRKLLGLLLLIIGVAVTVVLYEAFTSRIQSRHIARYAAKITYTLENGPSDNIAYPEDGPYDKRLGYAQLPDMLEQLQPHGMSITYQTRFSPALLNYTARGYFTPYPEKSRAGLHIVDSRGASIYKFKYPHRVYPSFESVPPLTAQALQFIEDRNLLNPDKPYLNPAVDWKRFTKALLYEAANKVGLNYGTFGGSTLATQIEKFRHSPEGYTINHQEKLRQMISASVRAYQGGHETLPARRALLLSYVNSVPLSGAPGYGEVHGLGDGLWVWFGADFDSVNHLLRLPVARADTLLAQGYALRQVLSLMIAQRRPSYYLGSRGRVELSTLSGSYLRLLEREGYISAELRDAGLAREVSFRDFEKDPAVSPVEHNKGILMARTHLSGMLGTTLHDLDRLDLAAATTLRHDLQEQVTHHLDRLSNPAFADTLGLLGHMLLSEDHTEQVHYSFTLFERTPQGNLVRVQTDNTGQPFDINEDSKLELGSTAKLRVLVHYLEVIAEVHNRYAGQPQQVVQKARSEPQDNLTRWVLDYLITAEDKSLRATLEAALERRYTANPREAFFTGGGMHTFRNFRSEDNWSSFTVRESLMQSVNLPFVRLMRDLVRYSIHQSVSNSTSLLENDGDPRRREYLIQFADKEAKVYLQRFWQKYNGKSPEERLNLLLNGLYQHPVRLAVVHRYLYPETDLASFKQFLRERLPNASITDKRIQELHERYGPSAYSLPDQGYIARVHPLELWVLQYLLQSPDATWDDAVEASKEQRLEVYAWLFKSKVKSARDSRIRTMLEIEAFQDIHKRWKRLGYPFDHLVPSLATALGSSGDRPAALAELMGIIVNDGVRKPTIRINKMHFAANTPYETALEKTEEAGELVLAPEVAAVVRGALSGVVEDGTASRIKGAITKADGQSMRMGGKTGTGDNRKVTLSTSGHRLSSRAVNRTATFVFFLGEDHFGTLTAYVPGREAANFQFTSSLPLQVLRSMAPILQPYLEPHTDTTLFVIEPNGTKAAAAKVAEKAEIAGLNPVPAASTHAQQQERGYVLI